MRNLRLLCLVILGLILTALLSFNALAQKGKPPSPPPPPANPVIAYSAPGQNSSSLMVMNADGTNQRVVLSAKFTYHDSPDWSPDGTQLVFVRTNVRDGSSGTYIVNLNGTGLTRIANPSQQKPAWSPVRLGDENKYKIVFSSRVNPEDGTIDSDTDLFLVNIDGTGLTRLTDTDDINEGCVDWSPTGDRIVADVHNLHAPELWVYQVECAAGCSATPLTRLINVSNSPLAGKDEVGLADWAKTKDTILVSASMDPAWDLWAIDLANPSQPRQLTNTAGMSEHSASFSPDDTQNSFVRGPSGGWWVMNSDGTGPQQKALPTAGSFSYAGATWRRNP